MFTYDLDAGLQSVYSHDIICYLIIAFATLLIIYINTLYPKDKNKKFSKISHIVTIFCFCQCLLAILLTGYETSSLYDAVLVDKQELSYQQFLNDTNESKDWFFNNISIPQRKLQEYITGNATAYELGSTYNNTFYTYFTEEEEIRNFLKNSDGVILKLTYETHKSSNLDILGKRRYVIYEYLYNSNNQ